MEGCWSIHSWWRSLAWLQAYIAKAIYRRFSMQDAYAVVQRWGEAFNRGDADSVAALYAPAATIWGTLAQYIATSPTEILDYFREAARAEFRVKLGPYVISPIGESGFVICGHYELSRPLDGRILALP